jgi:hypothetical protein
MTTVLQAISDFFTSLVGLLSSAVGILVLLLSYALTHPETVEKWHSILARALSYRSERAEKATVSTGIQAEINSFAKDMNKETMGAMPYGIKIEWTKDATRETVLESGEVIVRMKHHRDQSRNLVYATLAYISKGFLPHGRSYLEEKIAKSADHIMTRKIFVRRNLDDALHLYVSEFLEPEVKIDPTIQQHCDTFERLDGMGFFTKIFAREMERLGLKLYPAIATSDIVKDTSEFVDFLKRVAEREPGERVPGGTLFVRPRFGTAIALIASGDTLALAGVSPHLAWISDCWQRGADTVYVLARGSTNIKVAQGITAILVSIPDVEKVSEDLTTVYSPEGQPIPCIVTVLRKKGA